MFDDWKTQMNRYVQKHIDRRLFDALMGELDADIVELSNHYTSVLLENGVIDEAGCETELDFDEDDLMEAILSRFLQNRIADEDRELLYATLIDAYLALVTEASEDI